MTDYLSSMATAIFRFKKNLVEIKNLQIVKETIYTSDIYKRVIEIINDNRLDELQQFPECKTLLGEELTIVRFYTGENSLHLALIYDSVELWQDPEVLEMFLIE